MKHLLILGTLWISVFSSICLGDSPIAIHPPAPKFSMSEAIKLVSAQIQKDSERKDHYISKIELIESSMVPPPQGSSRHWKAVSRKHREKKAEEVILYVGMDGKLSEIPPAGNSGTREKGDDGKNKECH